MNKQISESEQQKDEYIKHIAALKDIIKISKQMILIREGELKEVWYRIIIFIHIKIKIDFIQRKLAYISYRYILYLKLGQEVIYTMRFYSFVKVLFFVSSYRSIDRKLFIS